MEGARGRNRDHDGNGRYTRNGSVCFTVTMHLYSNRYFSERGYHWSRSAYPCGPPLMCVVWHVVNAVRFLKECLFATLRFAEADLRGASTGRELARGLPYPPRGHGVTAVRPAPLAKQGAPQHPRQDLTSGRAKSEHKGNGTADGIRDRGDLKHPLELPHFDSSGGASPSYDTCLEGLKRSSFNLNVGTDTLYASLKMPRSSACNASFPHVPVPSRAAC